MSETQTKHNSISWHAAIEYGIDMSLVEANFKKTPEQRIRDINNAWLGVLELRKGLNKAKKYERTAD